MRAQERIGGRVLVSELDLVILAGIGFSAVLSFFRGVIREALSLLVWLAAILISLYYSSRFASLLPIDAVQSPLARANTSAVLLFLGTLFVGTIAKWFVTRILAGTSLSVVDRLGGAIFGALRGAVIFTLLVLGANLAPELKSEPWWQNSKLIPRFQSMAAVIHARLPETIGRHFDIN